MVIYSEDKNIEINTIESEINHIISNLKENTLIISEKTQNVILPYTISELKQKLKDNSEQYFYKFQKILTSLDKFIIRITFVIFYIST